MAYTVHFQLVDDLITHLDQVVPVMTDPFITSRYTGFLAVSATSVLELAWKTIFSDFAHSQNPVFGRFCDHYFQKINGRIKLRHIKEDYLSKFGIQYQRRFSSRLEVRKRRFLRIERKCIVSSYGNLIEWRHQFAHQGILPPNASYGEVKEGYSSGKRILQCAATCLR